MMRAIRKQPIALRFQNGLASQLSGYVNTKTFEAFVSGELSHEAVNAVSSEINGEYTKLKYESLIECLQSIILFNGQIVNSTKVEYVDPATNTCCKLRIGEGFGDDSSPLIVKELMDDYGFIPYHRLNQAIFDGKSMSLLHAKCLKCFDRIQVEGFDPNLTYWAGECGDCNYDSPENLLLPFRAISFPGEKFTRVMEVYANDTTNVELHVELPELKEKYESVHEFCNTIGPILRWEMTALERIYDAHGDAAELVGGSDMFHQLKTSMLLTMRMKKSQMWNRENFKRIGFITIRLNIYREGHSDITELCHMKSTNFWLEEDGDGKHCIVTFRVDDEDAFALYNGERIMVTPAPSQIMYSTSMKVLNNFHDGMIAESLLTRKILGLPTNTRVKREPSVKEYSFFDGLFHMRQSLTEIQLRKVDTALANDITVIDDESPNNFTISAAILLSSILDGEKDGKKMRALVVGADETICENLGNVLEEMVRLYWPEESFYTVLRVFSKVDAIRMRSKGVEYGGPVVASLHDQIDTSISQRRACQEKEQLNLLKEGKYVEMDAREQQIWLEKSSNLERNIARASSNRIIIGTPEALAESQVISAYSGNGHQFETVLFENAHAMTLDKLVPFLSLQRIERIVISERNVDKQQHSLEALTVSGQIAGINKPLSHWLM